MEEILRRGFKQHQEVIDLIIHDDHLQTQIKKSGDLLVKCFIQKNRVWFCGNGGSASDAQHLAAELSGRFYLDREALPAEALHVNSSFLTAVGNDFGYQEIYARALEAHADEGDVLILLSTSGKSANIIKAAAKARNMNITTISITGTVQTELYKNVDIAIDIPSKDTPRIQEASLLIGHLICEYVENTIFGL